MTKTCKFFSRDEKNSHFIGINGFYAFDNLIDDYDFYKMIQDQC